jgi:hypothetical protein
MLDGVDPVIEQAKRQDANRVLVAAQSVTLRQIMEHYLEHKRTKHGPLRPRTKKSIRETIERYLIR